MKPFDIKHGVTVNPDEVSSIEVEGAYNGSVFIYMKNGRMHKIECDHQKSISETHDRLKNRWAECLNYVELTDLSVSVPSNVCV